MQQIVDTLGVLKDKIIKSNEINQNILDTKLQELSNKTTIPQQQQLQQNVTLDVISEKLMKDNEKRIIKNRERQQIEDELLLNVNKQLKYNQTASSVMKKLNSVIS